MILIWTDGSCPMNPGPGGWGVVVSKDGDVVAKLHGGEEDSTNNRMEMMAVAEAMRFLRVNYPGEEAEIISDSEYVVKGITEWSVRWKERGWVKKGGDIKNLALWKLLDHLKSDAMEFSWVKGHAGDPMNELADHLAGLGSSQVTRVVDDPAEAFEERFV